MHTELPHKNRSSMAEKLTFTYDKFEVENDKIWQYERSTKKGKWRLVQTWTMSEASIIRNFLDKVISLDS